MIGWVLNYSVVNKCYSFIVIVGVVLVLVVGLDLLIFFLYSYLVIVGSCRCLFFSNKLVYCRCEFWLYFIAIELIILNVIKDGMRF